MSGPNEYSELARIQQLEEAVAGVCRDRGMTATLTDIAVRYTPPGDEPTAALERPWEAPSGMRDPDDEQPPDDLSTPVRPA